MSRATLMKRLTFNEQDREDIVLSDAWIRLDPYANCVRLTQEGGLYDKGTGHYVISPVTQPGAVRRWVGFQADVIQPKCCETSVRFRIHDGTDHLYWDGDAWAGADADEWNTEAEIAAHISAYDAIDTRTLRVVVNLISVDGRGTPDLMGVRLAYEAELPSEREDLIYRTLVPAFKTIRATVDFAAKAVAAEDEEDTEEINLGAAVDAAKIPFRITGVDAVFNHSDDPDHLADLADGYDTATRIVALSAAVAAGKDLVIRVVYQPSVTFDATDPDYVELAAVPSLVLAGAREISSAQGNARDEVVNRGASAPTAIVFPAPRRTDYRMDLVLSAPGGVDLQRFQDAVLQWLDTHRILRTAGTDEPFELAVAEPFSLAAGSGKGVRSARAVIELRNVYLHGAALDGVYPVQSFRTTGNVEVVV